MVDGPPRDAPSSPLEERAGEAAVTFRRAWSPVLGIWSFFGAWSLEFGAFHHLLNRPQNLRQRLLILQLPQIRRIRRTHIHHEKIRILRQHPDRKCIVL